MPHVSCFRKLKKELRIRRKNIYSYCAYFDGVPDLEELRQIRIYVEKELTADSPTIPIKIKSEIDEAEGMTKWFLGDIKPSEPR